MSDVVEELKAKLAEKKDRLEAIRVEQAALEEEVIAFETVIACYDPSIRPSGTASFRRPVSTGGLTPTKRVTALLKGRNSRHIVLEILRWAERPVAAAEIAQSFVDKEQLADRAAGLSSHITSRFATVLNGLRKQGLVRFEPSEDGNSRRLWEIAR
ncbi:hypothetical protein C8J34_10210 [Rhizobium sp. PP-F2F-G36]|nr:hypothetical protein C8J34_10210 [Rhizobium sp. PP-F2F-G36]